MVHALELAIITLTALAIIIPILWDTYKKRKQLSWEILSAEALRKGMPGLETTFNQVPIENPHLCRFSITNTGSVPIAVRDFQSPVEVSFKPCSVPPRLPVKVLAAELETNPANLRPSATISPEGRLIIQPLLLNPKDQMTFRVLLDQCFDRETVDIDSRIEGVSEIELQGVPKFPIKTLLAGVVLGAGGGLSLYYNISQLLGWSWLIMAFGALTLAEAVDKVNIERRRELGLE